MKHDDIFRQIPDYVLGLLPANQLHVVERHLAHCAVCQQAMVRERTLERLVRSTVDVATKPDPMHMRNLMPAIPQREPSGLILHGWQRQLAPALLILILLFGGMIINSMLPDGSVPAFVATAHAATATSTYTPTATMAQMVPKNEETDSSPAETDGPVLQAVMPIPAADADRPVETPDPLPTPVAAIRQSVQ